MRSVEESILVFQLKQDLIKQGMSEGEAMAQARRIIDKEVSGQDKPQEGIDENSTILLDTYPN